MSNIVVNKSDLVTVTAGPWLMYTGFVLQVWDNGNLLLGIGRIRLHVHKRDVLPYNGKARADAVYG